MDNKLHYVIVTGIIIKDGKFLIAKRASWEKSFPGYWTVPGGKLETNDYIGRQKTTSTHWYNVLEKTLRREVKEEVNLEIKNIRYITNMTHIRIDNIPEVIISLFCDFAYGEIILCNALTEYAWVSLNEAKKYDLIEGIYEELEMVEKIVS